MTNFVAIVWLGWVTNIVAPDVRDDSLRRNGYTWLETNIASVVIVIPVDGVGNVTNIVPVSTNVSKFTITQTPENVRVLSKAEADRRGLPPVPSLKISVTPGSSILITTNTLNASGSQ